MFSVSHRGRLMVAECTKCNWVAGATKPELLLLVIDLHKVSPEHCKKSSDLSHCKMLKSA